MADPTMAAPNPEDYPLTYNSHNSLLALGITLLILSVIALGVRIISQIKYFQKIYVGDMFIVPAFILTTGLAAAVIAGTNYGWLGSHSDPKDMVLFVKINQFEYGFWIGYVLAVGCIKLSILFFFRLLFHGRAYRSAFDYTNWALIGFTVAWTVTYLFATIFICGDTPSALWRTSFWIQQKCVNTYQLYLTCSVFNVAIDLGILIEPLIMVSNLQMNGARKLQAFLIFMISILAVVAGLMRMVFWIQSNIGSRTRLVYNEVGLSYPITDLEPLVSICIFWTMMEVGVGFIIACLLPSAKLLDAVANSPFAHKIKSLTSLVSSRSTRSVRTKSSTEEKSFSPKASTDDF